VADAERTTVGAADESRKPAGLPASGFAVWTSNRFGSHEIVRFDFVSGQLDRLTETPGKEYYVSVSPDGTRLVYAYAEAPGHSFRNLTGWSVVVKDLQSGITRRVAEEGFHPAWAGSSRYLTYSRGANEVVLHDLETDSVETLIRAGSNGIPSGFQFWTPSYDPSSGALAVTIRGSRRTKMLYYPKREKAAIEMPEGCQLSWMPSGKRLVYTADGNRGGNTFVTVRPDGNDAQVLLELGTAYNHLYFPRFSGDGSWLIYAASAGGHEHDQADYEVFLWRVGTAPEHIQRLSADPGNDAWPALYVPST
jgi:Tol biopolymer transport system component